MNQDGTPGPDTLNGTSDADTLAGGDGNDILNGGGGKDFLYGGKGDDQFNFVFGDVVKDEVIEAGEGFDTAVFYGSNDLRFSTFRDFEQVVFAGPALLQANDYNIPGTVIGGTGASVLSIQATKTAVDLSNMQFLNWELIDRVELVGTDKSDLLRGAAAGTNLYGGLGDDALVGGAGHDLLVGGLGKDAYIGGGGNDTYQIDAGESIAEAAGDGVDTILSVGSLSLAEYLNIENLGMANAAGATSAKLTGNALANALTGDAGSNVLAGGLGKDSLDGGAGKDFFVFDTALSKANVDTIVKYSAKDDTIRLENAVFKGLKTGKLAKDAFAIGKAAQDASDRVIYDKGTGALYYDPDGAGGAAQIKFAILSKKLALTSADFVVI